MRNFLKKITHPFLKLGLKIYYFNPRAYSYDGIDIKVHPDVFPPHLTFSTKIILNFIATKELKDKTFLELGCGCGIVSLFAAKREAQVTATDINDIALQELRTNSSNNQLQIEILYSDLFQELKGRFFNFIVINPPYYPKTPQNIKEKAWFCGENFEYFESLFAQLKYFVFLDSEVYVILSEDCDYQKIETIALKNTLALDLIKKVKNIFELNYIYKVKSIK